MPDENNETRRQRNIRFNVEELTPDLMIPELGEHLWNYFFELSSGTARISQGVCYPLGWNEIKAWSEIMDQHLEPFELEIIRAMDHAYCIEMNNEFADYRAREEDRTKTKGK